MPKPFQLQRFEALLRKRLGLQGLIGLTLLEDVQCVIPVWGPGLPEDLFLKGENRWAQHIIGGPSVGNFTGALFSIPVAVKTIAVIESVDNISPVQDIHVGVFAVGGGPGGGPGQPLDLRQFSESARPVAAPSLYNAAVANVANPVARLRVTGIGWKGPIILPPNTSFAVEGVNANTAFGCIFQWREFALATDQELQQHG